MTHKPKVEETAQEDVRNAVTLLRLTKQEDGDVVKVPREDFVAAVRLLDTAVGKLEMRVTA